MSEARAEIAKQYLVSRGIDADRIQTFGYGETQPEVEGTEIKNLKDKKEREAAHQRNRRIVVTFLRQ